jgi:hypothetical protein
MQMTHVASGNIFDGLTAPAKVTFSNGLTRPVEESATYRPVLDWKPAGSAGDTSYLTWPRWPESLSLTWQLAVSYSGRFWIGIAWGSQRRAEKKRFSTRFRPGVIWLQAVDDNSPVGEQSEAVARHSDGHPFGSTRTLRGREPSCPFRRPIAPDAVAPVLLSQHHRELLTAEPR